MLALLLSFGRSLSRLHSAIIMTNQITRERATAPRAMISTVFI